MRGEKAGATARRIRVIQQLVTGAMASLDTLDGDETEPQARSTARPNQRRDDLPGEEWNHRSWRWQQPWSSWDWRGNSWPQGSWWSGSQPGVAYWQDGNGAGSAADAARDDPAADGVAAGEVTATAEQETGTDPLSQADPWGAAAATATTRAEPGREESTWDSSSSWQYGWGWNSSTWHSGGYDWRWNSAWSAKPDLSDPPAWPGWSHRRLWVQAVRRWNKTTDIPVHRRSEKLLRSLGWELASEFEHLSEGLLASEDYLEAIIEVMNSRAGVREDDEKRRAYRQAITETQRKRDESLAQYALRRQRDFRQASNYGVQIPDSLKAMLLREGAGLSDQNQQNLTALLQGSEDNPDSVARALGRMDVRADRLVAFTEDIAAEGNYAILDTEDAPEDEEDLETEEILGELEPLDLTEDQVCEVFAVLEQRRRTWKENKILKADMKKDRGTFVKDGGASFPRGQSGGTPGGAPGGNSGFRRRRQHMNREQLKKISKCRLCLQKGHWAEDCTAPPRKKPTGTPSAFAYLSPPTGSSRSAFAFVTLLDLKRAVQQVTGGAEDGDQWAFLQLPTGDCAILDIGATQDLIGTSALEAMTQSLRQVGLQPVKLDKVAMTPSGIGGAAKALSVVLLPVSPGGVPGVLEVTVLQGNIPPLLSVGFLDHLKAAIDLETNKINMKALGLELTMSKLPSGHRTISLVQWGGGDFPIPDEVSRKYGLAPGAFNVVSSDSCAYTKGEVVLHSEMKEGVFYQEEQNEPNDVVSVFKFECNCSLFQELGSDACAVTNLAEHSNTCAMNLSSWNGNGVALEDDVLTCHARHEQHDHDADSQHPLLESSSCPMGSRQSPAIPQFVAALPDRDEHGPPFRSTEQRGRGIQPKHTSMGALGKDAAGCGTGVGVQPHELSSADQGRASHQVSSVAQATTSRRSCGGQVLPSCGDGDLTLQPVCHVEGVPEMQRQDCISFKENGIQEPGLCIDETFGKGCASANHVAHELYGLPRCGSEHSRGPPGLPAPEHAVRPDDAASRSLITGTGERSEPDAGVDAGDPRGCQHGAMVGCLGTSTKSQRKPVKTWPSWMVTTGALATTLFLTQGQCSEAFQTKLQGYGYETDEFYAFEYELGGTPGHLQQDPDSSAEERTRPSWLPDFMQEVVNYHSECSRLSPEHCQDQGWCPLWRKVINNLTGQIIENSPGPLSSLDFEAPLDLKVIYWGLPMDFLRLHAFSSMEEAPLRLNSAGEISSSGEFWVVRSDMSRQLSEAMSTEAVPEVGSEADLKRCATNLCFMAQQRTNRPAQHLDFVELFSPPRVVPHARALGLQVDMDNVFDLTHGWDVRRKDHRQKFRNHQRKRCPKTLMASPVCKAFTLLRQLNRSRMDPQKMKEDLAEGVLMWDFSLQAIEEQLEHGDYFGLEHPETASSWTLPQTQPLLERPDVAVIVFDMCHWGLDVKSDGILSRKSTRFATNNPWLAQQLALAQCDGQHEHRHLIGGLPSLAQEYPPALCECIAKAAQAATLKLPTPSFLQLSLRESTETSQVYYGEGEEADPELHEAEPKNLECPALTESQKRQIHRVHINTGHPPQDRFLRALRAAGALPQVLHYVKNEYRCDDCAIKQGPDVHRRAQMPRTYSFNKVLCVDFFYVKWRDESHAILNLVDLGTSYQVAVRAPVADGTSGGTPTSRTAWNLLVTTWIRFFGSPQLIICDSGNEFKGAFERALEHMGILQHVIHPECPHENGRAERHGGWLKQRIDKEISSGRTLVHSLQDLDELLSAVTSAKNNWLNRGGFTPAQLVFGQLPRVSGDLLQEDELSLHGMQDAYSDPMEVDEAAGEYRRRHQIRERGRQLAMQQDSKDAIQIARKSAVHQSRNWYPGQWVYVYRRARANQELHLRDRWVGPGVIVLVNNNTIYVGMRTRLWRCSAEQVRPALSSEILGKELASDPGLAALLRQVVSGTRAGAVDVAREGPPPPDGQLRAVEHDDQGVSRSGVVPAQPSPADQEQQQAAIEAVPIPPGILPAPPPPQPAAATPLPSRRSSTQEPASEPGIPDTPADIIDLSEPPGLPGLQPIVEAEEIHSSSSDSSSSPASRPAGSSPESVIPDPPTKVPRLTSPGLEMMEPTSETASSSQDQPQPSAEPMTRAPGTPVAQLLERIPRDRSPRRSPTLTPSELLPAEGRVPRQVEEREEVTRALRGNSSDDTQTFSEVGWSGNFFNYGLGDQQLALDAQGKWTFLAKRNDEVSPKTLNLEEQKKFLESDKLEWEAILKTKAVRVVYGKEAQELRRRHPDRILSSRMVRRKKPQPELHSWKAKSRWCIHGHTDPDTGTLTTYAPTPQSEGMMLFLQTSVNHRMKTAFSDVKNAFCQSDKMVRPNGPIFAEPCEGLNLPPGALIVIEIPVYGLDDAPAKWRATVANYLVNSLGCERNIVEPCWYSKFCPKSGKCMAQVLVEVDDFVVSAIPEYYEQLKKEMQERFHFGKWEEDEAEYAGRHIRCTKDAIYVDQHKYIHEQIHPIPLAKGRRQQAKESLSPEEFTALRSLIYKINWVARETRPEAAGLASVLASKLQHSRVEDILLINKFVNFLRTTSSRPLTIWRMDPTKMCFVVCSDAGGINTKDMELTDSEGLPTDATQGAWMVLAAEALPCGTQRVKATPIAWRSSKLKRKVFSTYGGETQAMLQGVNEVDWLQVMYRDATYHDVTLDNWRASLSPHMLVMRGQCHLGGRQQQCSVTDAKSLYDCLLREHPTGKQDRKSALELAIILRDLQETKSMVRWVPHQKMLVDCLTKEDPLRANDALNQFLRTGVLSLVDVADELEARKNDSNFRKRSNQASRKRLLEEYQENFLSFISFLHPLIDYIWGDCENEHMVSMKTIDQRS